jgi:hypothetical protein
MCVFRLLAVLFMVLLLVIKGLLWWGKHGGDQTFAVAEVVAIFIQSVGFQTVLGAISTWSFQQYSDCASILRELCDIYPIAKQALGFLEDIANGGPSVHAFPLTFRSWVDS